jgi:hypothetical protein
VRESCTDAHGRPVLGVLHVHSFEKRKMSEVNWCARIVTHIKMEKLMKVMDPRYVLHQFVLETKAPEPGNIFQKPQTTTSRILELYDFEILNIIISA